MTGDLHPFAAVGFERAADEYERARPGYAAEAVQWIVETARLGPGKTVVDLGAGTGKLTRLLVPSGAKVVAVEPVEAMRARLVSVIPAVEAREGRAEEIPLPDGVADAVTAAQAFHWFEAQALTEIHRILRPGGLLAVIWNKRAEDPLQDRLEDLYLRLRPEYGSDSIERLEASELFTPLGERNFGHVHRLPRDEVVTRFASISFVAAMEPAERERVLDEVREITADWPDEVDLPYLTTIRAFRRT